jgi:methylmalonyl-CoA epimerase
MLKIVDHIGIAVPSIADALEFWAKGLNNTVAHEEEVPSQKVKTAFLPVGEVNIELLEPTSDESPIAKALAKRGPGVHHICFEVEDIVAALAHLKEQGVTLIDKEPRLGAHGKMVAFVHPKSTGGVLVELSQPTK